MRKIGAIERVSLDVKHRDYRTVFFLALCGFFLFINSCARTGEPAQESSERSADPPRVTKIDDARIKQLLKPNGKPLLVNFWATWCGPCREEFPDLVEIDAEYRGKIDFFTVSLDFVEELEAGVPKFLSEAKAQMPTYLLTSADENELISSIAKGWSGALPFTILYNERGEITYLRQGKVDGDTLKSEIQRTLGEQTNSK